jgi:hypothetical protein
MQIPNCGRSNYKSDGRHAPPQLIVTPPLANDDDDDNNNHAFSSDKPHRKKYSVKYYRRLQEISP